MADLNVKFATGEKGKIEEAKTAGKLDANDFVVTTVAVRDLSSFIIIV